MIVCLVANPSIDKLFEVERLVRGDIHRPVGFEQTAGGKGLNVARAVSALGGDVRAVALFRGHSGKWLEETLSSEGVHGSFVWTHGENRSSLSVADRETGGLTEFYEHGSEVPSSAWPELANATAALFGETTWLTISGSVPVGIDDSAYRDLVGEARAVGVRVALDAEGDRLRLALEGQPDVVKVNASEASELLGVPTARRDEAMAAAQKLRELAGGDGHVGIVTRGADGVVVCRSRRRAVRGRPVRPRPVPGRQRRRVPGRTGRGTRRWYGLGRCVAAGARGGDGQRRAPRSRPSGSLAR